MKTVFIDCSPKKRLSASGFIAAMMANRFGVSGGASAIEGHTFECTSIFA